MGASVRDGASGRARRGDPAGTSMVRVKEARRVGQGMRFGICLPAFAWPQLTFDEARALRNYARAIEELGFDGIWTFEHLLPAEPRYVVSWLSPLIALAYAAAVTERVDLGTAVLILPMYNPVVLAKQLTTLNYLSGGRLIVGFGAGWMDKELLAAGSPVQERGARAAEAFAIIRQLFQEPQVTHRGRFWTLEGVTLEPRRYAPRFWAGGGSSWDRPLPKRVLNRIAACDGWVLPAHGNLEQIRSRYGEVMAFLQSRGLQRSRLTVAKATYFYVVDTADRDRALAEQRSAFSHILHPNRPWESVLDAYLLGTPDDMARRIKEWRGVGIDYLIMHPANSDRAQLQLLREKVLAHV